MAKLNDLSTRQLKLLGASLLPILASIDESEESESEILNDIQFVLCTLSDVINEREETSKQFRDIVNDLLVDVERNSLKVISNPDIELPEYK